MINEQITKMAAARDKAVADKQAAAVAAGAQKAGPGTAAPPPFDVAKFAGIFAAIGLAVGAIGTAMAAVVTGFLKLYWWQMPLAIVGLVLIISLPSMVLAWLKLRQRTIGPILDANGWAINGRLRINVAFGTSLTKVASLPAGVSRGSEDPFADQKSPWPKIILLVFLLAGLLYILWRTGLLGRWIGAIFGA
jgi:ABC-type multidrug transport system fused ATPase/permease subunit